MIAGSSSGLPQTRDISDDASTGAFSRYEALLRMRAKRRFLFHAVLVLLPVVLALGYAFFVAQPRYMTEARFSILGGNIQSPQTGNVSLIQTGGGGMPMMGIDGFAVRDFLTSRDAMMRLGKLIDLQKHFSRDGYDPWASLPSKPSADDLYGAYSSMVSVTYNIIEQIVVIDVQAFSPEDSASISRNLLTLADEFVNRMNARGLTDALKVASEAVEVAQRQDVEAREALEAWRNSSDNVDPVADTAMLTALIGQLEAQLASTRVTLANLRSFNNPNHPLLKPVEQQVAALRQRIEETRGRLSGGSSAESGMLKVYDALKATQDFADASLASARQTYEQARVDALRQQRYISVIAEPVPSDEADLPNTPLLAVEAFAAGLVLAFFGSLTISIGRSLIGF